MPEFTGGYRISLTNQLNRTSDSTELGFVGLEIIKVLSEHLAPVLAKFTDDELSQIDAMHSLRAHNVRELTPQQELLGDAKHYFRGEKCFPPVVSKIEQLNDNQAWLISAAVFFNELSPQSIAQFTDPARVEKWLVTHPEDVGEGMKQAHKIDGEYLRQLESGSYSQERFLQWCLDEAAKAREAQSQRQLNRRTHGSPIDLLSVRISGRDGRTEFFRVKKP